MTGPGAIQAVISGVLEHEIGANDRAIRSIARRRRFIVEPRDGLLQCALDAVRGDDEVRMEHFATRERDAARTSRDGKIGLNVANEGAEANTYAGCGAREVMGASLPCDGCGNMARRDRGTCASPQRVYPTHTPASYRRKTIARSAGPSLGPSGAGLASR